MGRTLPTFNLQLEREMEEWRPFRRALRREDQEVFDRLFALAKRHMAEAAYVARPVPFDTLVMAILLEMQKEIEQGGIPPGARASSPAPVTDDNDGADERNEEERRA